MLVGSKKIENSIVSGALPDTDGVFCFFYEIGEVVSNIRAYVRQDKWERAMDKFVLKIGNKIRILQDAYLYR